jgi:hypothetical protein
MDGLSAKLEPALGASTDSIDTDTVAKLRFEGDTFSGSIIGKDVVTDIAGFKFGELFIDYRILRFSPRLIKLNQPFRNLANIRYIVSIC